MNIKSNNPQAVVQDGASNIETADNIILEKISWYHSLVGRTIIVLAIVLAVLFFIDAWVRFENLNTSMTAQFTASAEQTADITAEGLARPVWDFNEEQIKKQIGALQKSGFYCGAEIANPDANGEMIFKDAFTENISENMILKRDIVFTKSAAEQYKVGILSLCFGLGQLKGNIVKGAIYIAIYQLITAILIILAVAIAVTKMTAPLKKLRFALRDMAPNWQPITDPFLTCHHDEIGRVVTVLNYQIEKLNHSQKLLQNARNIADAASATKSEFIAIMSHELRTPLNAIIGFSELINYNKDNSVPERFQDYIKGIHGSGIYLRDIINSILEFSQIDYELATINPSDIDAIKLAKKILASIAPQIEEAGIVLHADFGEGKIEIYSDERRLKKVLFNILSNAIKFTPRGKDVFFSIRKDSENHNVIFEIKDNGIGIAKDDIPKLFKPFIQIDSGLARKYGGTGLGLFIAKKIIECLNGTLHLDSETNVGTRVLISLPLFVK